MSDAALMTELSAVVRAAARGELPAWSRVSEKRRAHMGRVAALMGEWADGLGLSADERARWVAAGWLHDALREDAPDELRPRVPEAFRALPGKLLHGPAAAERLAAELDDEMREAICFHTLGSARWGRLGRALYLADFLEPGRRYEPEWTASLRARMPGDMDAVLREVVDARVRHVTESGSTLHPETRALHGQVVGA
jgi:HD superfamily phosphohydrolase YqeK